MPSATKLCFVTGLLLMMCTCQSFSAQRGQPMTARPAPSPRAVGVVHAAVELNLPQCILSE